ncbi:MAG: hypothetical protein QOJ65_880, partial [Fimbriimonadaceae bacterium]|nr:hypothetical protein [Fimbriimonadaceae bacterium]
MNDPQLVAALQNCSFHAFLLILQQVLSPMGYGDVQILDRRRSSQKSRHGGHELVCRTIAAGRLVTVVVKVLHDDVRIGQLDELAGVILRMDSDAGLVVTPHRVSKTAKAMLASNRYKPLQMNTIDGA